VYSDDSSSGGAWSVVNDCDNCIVTNWIKFWNYCYTVATSNLSTLRGSVICSNLLYSSSLSWGIIPGTSVHALVTASCTSSCWSVVGRHTISMVHPSDANWCQCSPLILTMLSYKLLYLLCNAADGNAVHVIWQPSLLVWLGILVVYLTLSCGHCLYSGVDSAISTLPVW